MPADECHIHWDGSPSSTINVLEQELLLTAEVSNIITVTTDPIGTVKIRQQGFVGTPLSLPTNGWQAIPGTSPVLEARVDGNYAVGYIRIRHA